MDHRVPLVLCLTAMLVAALTSAGCMRPRSRGGVGVDESSLWESGEPGVPSPAASRSAPAEEAGNRVVLVELHFDVLRVELPRGTIRHSTKIWNHVDELNVDPRLSPLLARNGLRIGVAEADAWPAIQAVLDANQARASRRQQAVQSGYPLVLNVGDVHDGETFFFYDADGQLHGSAFPPGEKYVLVDYAVDPQRPAKVTLRITPEIHCESQDKRWTQEGGVYQEKPRYQGRMFSELTAMVSLEPGQFLVIGPSELADLDFLLGSRFLEHDQGGVRYETLLFARPQPFRTDLAER
jgi:hypothetical protein